MRPIQKALVVVLTFAWVFSGYPALPFTGFLEVPKAHADIPALKIVVLTSGTSWTVPDDWNSASNTVEVIGGGGGGDGALGTGNGGGGGGAYAVVSDLSLTPGGSVTYQIGQGGGQDANGTDTFFNGSGTTCANSSPSVCADHGDAGVNATGGAGGSVASGIPASCADCANGGWGGDGNTTGDSGGGGGGAGGPWGAGADGGVGSNDGGRSDSALPGGGGGASGGTVGGDGQPGATSGAGGNGPWGTGGGAANSGSTGNPGTPGTGGGGSGPGELGAGGVSGKGATASSSSAWIDTITGYIAGPGGGGGGGTDDTNGLGTDGGFGGLYGAGGGGAEGTGGSGANGVIVITYTPSVVGTPSFYNDDGGSTQIAFDNAHINDNTPTFRLAATDPENDGLDYGIEIDDDPDFGSPNWYQYFSNGGSHYTSGTQVNLTMSTLSGIVDGTTYFVRASSTDPTGSGTYSANSTSTSFTYTSTESDPYWYQTTADQFDTDTLSGVFSSTTADLLTLQGGSGSQAFSNTTPDTWDVPAGVTELEIKAWGAGGGGGGGGTATAGAAGGGGGFAHGSAISVTPGETLDIIVGGGGGLGVGQTGAGDGGGGGGETRVTRQTGTVDLVIAGGGGGGGGGDNGGSASAAGAGGAGGGATGETGESSGVTGGGVGGSTGGGGNGGTGGWRNGTAGDGTGGGLGAGETAGGDGGANNGGTNGGGDGGLKNTTAYGAGGGGGHGRYGGGGGSSACATVCSGGGGGGGSNLVTGTTVSNTQGSGATGAGQADGDYPGGVGDGGGGGGTTSNGSAGENGYILISWDQTSTLGHATSTAIEFDSMLGGSAWDQVTVNGSTTNGTILVKVYDETLAYTGLSCSMSSDQSSCTIDLTSLDPTGDADEDVIYLAATLTDSGGSPTLTDWAVTVVDIPTVVNLNASSITASGATLAGNVTAGANITHRGFASSTDSALSTGVATSSESGSFGTGTFTSTMGGLTGNTTYYFRAYASSTAGIGYATTTSFLTLPGVPTSPSDGMHAATTTTLSWAAPTGGADSYKLVYCTGGTCVQSTGLSVTSTSTNTLVGNTTYTWSVRGTNGTGDGLPTATSTFKTLPDTPQSLDDGTPAATSTTLSWAAPTGGADSYDLIYCNGGTCTQSYGLTVTSTTTNALTGFSAYNWTVRAVNTEGEGLFAATTTFSTLPDVPGTPTLVSTGATTTSLTWTGSPGGTLTYELVQCYSGGCTIFTGLDSNATTTYGLTGNTSYTYQVRGANDADKGLWSASSTAILTLPDVPQSPTTLTPTTASTTLIWSAPTGGVSSYKLVYCTGGTCVQNTGLTTTSTSTNPLTSNTAYTWTVRGTNTTGDGLPTATSTFETLPGAPDSPSFSNVAATSTTVSWNDMAGAVDYYQLEQCATGTSDCALFSSIASYSTTTYGLTGNTQYDYAVRAVTAAGAGAYSATTSILLIPGIPGTPEFTNAFINAVDVIWTGSVGSSTSYKVERCVGAGCTDFSQVAAVGTTSVSESGLNTLATYRYRVRGTNATGDGLYSDIGTVTLTTIIVAGGGGGGGQDIGGPPPAGQGIVGGGGGGGGEDIGTEEWFVAPTASGAATGYASAWSSPGNAYASDASYATANAISASDFYNFGFSIPGTDTIVGIAIKLEASASAAGGTIGAELSWNGGSATTTSGTLTSALTDTDVVYTLGGATSVFGRTWSPSEFSNANFRLRLIAYPAGNTPRIDAIQVRVYHQAGGGGGGGGGDI